MTTANKHPDLNGYYIEATPEAHKILIRYGYKDNFYSSKTGRFIRIYKGSIYYYYVGYSNLKQAYLHNGEIVTSKPVEQMTPEFEGEIEALNKEDSEDMYNCSGCGKKVDLKDFCGTFQVCRKCSDIPQDGECSFEEGWMEKDNYHSIR